MQDQNQLYQQNTIVSTPNISNDNIQPKNKKRIILFSICVVFITITIIAGAIFVFNFTSKNQLQAKIDSLDKEIKELSSKESDIFFETGFSDEYFDTATEKTQKILEKESLEKQL